MWIHLSRGFYYFSHIFSTLLVIIKNSFIFLPYSVIIKGNRGKALGSPFWVLVSSGCGKLATHYFFYFPETKLIHSTIFSSSKPLAFSHSIRLMMFLSLMPCSMSSLPFLKRCHRLPYNYSIIHFGLFVNHFVIYFLLFF